MFFYSYGIQKFEEMKTKRNIPAGCAAFRPVGSRILGAGMHFTALSVFHRD
jgi:hypothetical protein